MPCFRGRRNESLLVDMWLTFRNRRKFERNLHLGILMLSLEALLLRLALAGLRDVNLDAQISWQAQFYVDLEVPIPWQVQGCVNLEVQILWQAQYCALGFAGV